MVDLNSSRGQSALLNTTESAMKMYAGVSWIHSHVCVLLDNATPLTQSHTSRQQGYQKWGISSGQPWLQWSSWGIMDSSSLKSCFKVLTLQLLHSSKKLCRLAVSEVFCTDLRLPALDWYHEELACAMSCVHGHRMQVTPGREGDFLDLES